MDDATDSDDVRRMLDERTYSYAGFDELLTSDPEWAGRYDALAEFTLRTDTEALPRKTRELITVALTAANGMPEPCANHIRDARRHGAGDDEVRAAIQLTGFLAGATSIITASKALDRADFFD